MIEITLSDNILVKYPPIIRFGDTDTRLLLRNISSNEYFRIPIASTFIDSRLSMIATVGPNDALVPLSSAFSPNRLYVRAALNGSIAQLGKLLDTTGSLIVCNAEIPIVAMPGRTRSLVEQSLSGLSQKVERVHMYYPRFDPDYLIVHEPKQTMTVRNANGDVVSAVPLAESPIRTDVGVCFSRFRLSLPYYPDKITLEVPGSFSNYSLGSLDDYGEGTADQIFKSIASPFKETFIREDITCGVFLKFFNRAGGISHLRLDVKDYPLTIKEASSYEVFLGEGMYSRLSGSIDSKFTNKTISSTISAGLTKYPQGLIYDIQDLAVAEDVVMYDSTSGNYFPVNVKCNKIDFSTKSHSVSCEFIISY